jgi:hypothetical protein
MDQVPGAPAWLKVVFALGAPTAIALFLVWRLADGVEAQNRDILAGVRAMQVAVQSHGEESSTALRDLNRELSRMLSAICVRVSQNERERAGCQ